VILLKIAAALLNSEELYYDRIFYIFTCRDLSYASCDHFNAVGGVEGGLTESFASAESMFGAKTNEFMIKATTVFASLFLLTCLGLAIVSSQKGKSLMSNKVAPQTQGIPTTQGVDAVIEEIDEIIVGDDAATEAVPIETELPIDTIFDDETINAVSGNQENDRLPSEDFLVATLFGCLLSIY